MNLPVARVLQWKRPRMRWLFLGFASFIAIVAIILFAVTVSVGGANLKAILESDDPGSSGIRFLGHIYNIDVDARQVQISWLIVGCGAGFLLDGTAGVLGAKNCGDLSRAIDIYVDGGQQVFSYDPGLKPIAVSTNQVIGVQATDRVETTHLLSIDGFSFVPNFSRGDQQSAFPFDRYDLETTFMTKDHNTNETLPILSLVAVDSTQNFAPHLVWDLPVMMNDVNGTTTSARTTHSRFGREALTKAFVVIIFVVNWLLTAVVVWITLRVAIGAEVDSGIMLLPVSVILTIPALRALWVGAPAFGLILDSCGLFPQMVVVAVCSVILVIYAGLQPPKDSEDSKDSKNKDQHTRGVQAQSHGDEGARNNAPDDREKGPLSPGFVPTFHNA
ncbi:hypothetical protein PUNSTDRAFT_144789 [Punctularia strigosozonata HHB-11173 SS5]|uniref:uncharacterized protein n=1 Tax=Punctularia strigosozonata (strain HHB-11173) TaxID=741275 RepID=UPI0004416326|nr:uncharacterized protein PUNSTDRAFT_144789 [Punctularia strigosozonata HHB-11173 SS5]EIN07272.1 hypothetical protein PUNSTDRAFT_144789 [Punctularia strigosozonata HHB-11173 SS5]